jgi:hypothetical protein
VLVPLGLLLAVVLSFEDQAKVLRAAELTPAQVARAKSILKTHDPRRAPPGTLRTISLSEDDLDVTLNYVLSQAGGGAKLALNPGAAMLWASIKVPPNPLGAYINVEAIAHQTSALPGFDRLQIGKVPVPAFLATWLLARALGRLNTTEAGKAAADTLESVRITAGHLVVEYRWREDLPERLRGALLAQDEQERLRAYHDRLVELSSSPRLAHQVSVLDLLRPLIALAAARSAKADAAAENRAALIALAFYVNGRGLGAIVANAKDWPRVTPRKITLSGRTDFPQRFTISAAIAATGGGPLADVIGLYKEVDDAREGTGFSFADIAADRAGTAFGLYATRSLKAAHALQNRVGAGIVERDVMPRSEDLPDMLPEAEFERRFGGVGAPAYARMMTEIERRVGMLALYR